MDSVITKDLKCQLRFIEVRLYENVFSNIENFTTKKMTTFRWKILVDFIFLLKT